MRSSTKLIVLWLFLSSVLSATDFRFVKIEFPHASATIASGINARGDIVGRYEDADGAFHGFVLRQGVFSTIDFPDASFTSARAINARGDIAGRMKDADSVDHAFLLHDGQFTQIDYPGADRTVGRGINNAGDITGNHFDSAGTERGFILRDGVFQNVSIGDANDIWMAQDNGQVMVGDAAVGPGGALHGYIRDKQGKFHLIDFPGLSVPCTGPRWINERGDIVGFFAYVNTVDDCFAPPPLHGFLLRQGEYVSIDFPGSISTELLAISDDGVIVGDYIDKHGVQHGFKAVPKE
jgi:uncharacterized membrane protein